MTDIPTTGNKFSLLLRPSKRRKVKGNQGDHVVDSSGRSSSSDLTDLKRGDAAKECVDPRPSLTPTPLPKLVQSINQSTHSLTNSPTIKRTTAPRSSLSKFSPSPQNTHIQTFPSQKHIHGNFKEIALLLLAPNESITFSGAVLIAPVRGAFSCFGHVFSHVLADSLSSWYPVYSPKTGGLVSIEAVDEGQAGERMGTGIVNADLGTLVSGALRNSGWQFKTGVIVAVASLAGTHINRLTRFFPDLWGNPSPSSLLDLSLFHPILGEPTPGAFALVAPSLPLSLLGSPLSPSDSSFSSSIGSVPTKAAKRIMVVGPKSSGKSTLSIFLLNALLNHHPVVQFLDSDLGQPEFTPSGLISIHDITMPVLGPAFTHLNITPRHAFYVGSTTPKHDPDLYLSYLEAMLPHVTPNVPLIINTHGWLKGVGFDLLKHFISIIKPDVILNLSGGSNGLTDDDMTLLVNPTLMPKVITLPSPVSIEVAASARGQAQDARALLLMSYFLRKTASDTLKLPFLLSPLPLTHLTPITVPISAVSLGFCGNDVPASHALDALVASVVGLCSSDFLPREFPPLPLQPRKDGADCGANNDDPMLVHVLSPMTPTPMHKCLGLGIVRAVDPITNKLLLLTPIPLDILQAHCNLLLSHAASLNGLEIPKEMLIEGFETASSLPLVSFAAREGVGASARRTRTNLLRRKNQT